MKQYWTNSEIIEKWSLLPDERLLLHNKTGSTRLGFALGLKFYQLYGRFPQNSDQIPKKIVRKLCAQSNVEIIGKSVQYNITKEHRKEIRNFCGFCTPTKKDLDELINWLLTKIIPAGYTSTKIHELARNHLFERSVESFGAKRMYRYVQTALKQFEDNLFEKIFLSLSTTTKSRIDDILKSTKHKSIENAQKTESVKIDNVTLNHLKQSAGRVSLKTILAESAKLQAIQKMILPNDLFIRISRKILKKYCDRVANELPSELQIHADKKKYAMVAIFCYMRQQEITDSLTDLFIQITHKIKARAEEKIVRELTVDFSQLKIRGKNKILYKFAKAAIEHPNGIIKDILYPIIGRETLQNLLQELTLQDGDFRQRIYKVIRTSYSHHYRQMLPLLLDTLDFHTNVIKNQPLLQAIKILRKYINSQLTNYPIEENIPIDDIIPGSWVDIITEVSESTENTTINRINYEIAVLHTLRERIRCKDIWIKNAYRYRNPDEDLPQDFEEKRDENYAALKKPLDKYAFTEGLKKEMHLSLEMLNKGILKNKKVKILKTKKRKKKSHNGWISLSPLRPQPDPHNIDKLKGEIFENWAATNLLDILKETDFRINFTSCFRSTTSRESLDRKTLKERLLLCLFGVATNIGIKRIRAGNQKISYQDLRYIYRRYISPSGVREAINQIVNDVFRVRNPQIWGEATTACASDSKRFGAWDQNLMTEWHARYRNSGIMVYWHVDKKAACIYSQIKTCASSEVASMIHGVLRHCTDMSVKKNYTDSRGQSIIGFAFSYLLNFELLPRLKNIGIQKLYFPETKWITNYKNIESILSSAIKWDLIHDQYDLIIKYATALHLGTADAEVILKRFTRNNSQHPVYKALMELGKAVKTIFLCKYLHSEALRREIHEGLNVVESWNSVNDFISYAKKSVIATNQQKDQELSLLCLHLLQISMVYINTLMIQQILKQPKWKDCLTIEDKRALSPLIYLHINPYGVFNLDLATRLPIAV